MRPARLHLRDIHRPGSSYDNTWYDVLGRPLLSGELWMRPLEVESDVSAPVKVPVVAGRVNVKLKPGTYKVTGTLLTVDRQSVKIDEDITVVPLPE